MIVKEHAEGIKSIRRPDNCSKAEMGMIHSRAEFDHDPQLYLPADALRPWRR